MALAGRLVGQRPGEDRGIASGPPRPCAARGRGRRLAAGCSRASARPAPTGRLCQTRSAASRRSSTLASGSCERVGLLRASAAGDHPRSSRSVSVSPWPRASAGSAAPASTMRSPSTGQADGVPGDGAQADGARERRLAGHGDTSARGAADRMGSRRVEHDRRAASRRAADGQRFEAQRHLVAVVLERAGRLVRRVPRGGDAQRDVTRARPPAVRRVRRVSAPRWLAQARQRHRAVEAAVVNHARASLVGLALRVGQSTRTGDGVAAGGATPRAERLVGAGWLRSSLPSTKTCAAVVGGLELQRLLAGDRRVDLAGVPGRCCGIGRRPASPACARPLGECGTRTLRGPGRSRPDQPADSPRLSGSGAVAPAVQLDGRAAVGAAAARQQRGAAAFCAPCRTAIAIATVVSEQRTRRSTVATSPRTAACCRTAASPTR